MPPSCTPKMENGIGCSIFLARQQFTVSEIDEYARWPGKDRRNGQATDFLQTSMLKRASLNPLCSSVSKELQHRIPHNRTSKYRTRNWSKGFFSPLSLLHTTVAPNNSNSKYMDPTNNRHSTDNNFNSQPTNNFNSQQTNNFNSQQTSNFNSQTEQQSKNYAFRPKA